MNRSNTKPWFLGWGLYNIKLEQRVNTCTGWLLGILLTGLRVLLQPFQQQTSNPEMTLKSLQIMVKPLSNHAFLLV
jgi:hypothetical protein